MENFQNVQTNKRLYLIITSLVWTINFRVTFKNIDAHMDLGSYSSIKFDPLIILIKNILCSIINLIIFSISLKINSSPVKNKILVKKETGSFVSYGYEEKEERDSLIDSVSQSHNLKDAKEKFIFWLKIVGIIIVIYIIEEIYFITANNHILDRLVVCMRNIGVLIPTFVLTSLLIKKNWHIYKHQLFPSIIIILICLFMILFNAISVTRFKKIFNINFLYYFIVYILTAVELVLIKYLVDIQFINIFLILGLKGLFGTIAFGVINIFVNSHKFFDFLDELFSFENEGMYEDFSITSKILYIISYLILQYLKIGIIQSFSENHFLSAAMISDVFYFPLYLVEKFAIQGFPITTSATFYLNSIFGIINTILLLIFNEVIEIKCWDVEKNTNKNIDQRQEQEIQLVNMDLKKIKTNDFENAYEEEEIEEDN